MLQYFSTCKLLTTIDEINSSVRGCPLGVMVKALDCGIVISEFKFALLYSLSDRYPGKGMNPFILPAMG